MRESLESISESLADLKDSIRLLTDELGKVTVALADMKDMLIKEDTLSGIINGISGFADIFGILVTVLTTSFSEESILGAIATTLGVSGGYAALIVATILVVIADIVLLIYQIVTHWEEIVSVIQQGCSKFQIMLNEINAFLRNLFVIEWTEQYDALGNVLNAFFYNVERIWDAVKRTLDGIVGYISSVFSGDWRAAWSSVAEIFSGIWDGIVAGLKVPINSVIGWINALIYRVVDGLNAVIGLINSLSFDIPD